MEWPGIQKRLLAAAAMLKEHKAVDIGIKSSLALIPVVGGFVSEYWDRLDVHGEAQASELAAVLTKLATREDLFERVARRLESQGNQLLEIKLSISQIVSDIETIADDTQYTRRMLEHWDAALRFGPAREIQAQGGDPALVRKALEAYQKLLELEAEDPRLPADALPWLKQLYDPIIASISGDG